MNFFAKRKLKKEQRIETAIYETLSDHDWWFVTDMLQTGYFPGLHWTSSVPTVYIILWRLESQGAIESKWIADEDEGLRRRGYRLTERKVATI